MEQNMESPATALEHIRFQLDLLRLTATPLKLGGVPAEALRPEVAAHHVDDELLNEALSGEREVVEVMQELSVAASQLTRLER